MQSINRPEVFFFFPKMREYSTEHINHKGRKNTLYIINKLP